MLVNIQTMNIVNAEESQLINQLINVLKLFKKVKLARITLTENENSYKCSPRTMYTALFWIFFTINVGGIGAYFIYFHWYLKKDVTRVEFNTRTQTDI